MSVQLHTYVETRLLRWKVYCVWSSDLLTRAPGPKAVKSWWLTIVMQPNVRIQRAPAVQRAACPVDEVECGITELCIQQLPQKLRDAVVLGYLATGAAVDKAHELNCDRATYFRRFNRAHGELLGLFNDHEAGVFRVDIDQANAELEAERTIAPGLGRVIGGALKRPPIHGISHAVRTELAPLKKASSGA